MVTFINFWWPASPKKNCIAKAIKLHQPLADAGYAHLDRAGHELFSCSYWAGQCLEEVHAYVQALLLTPVL